MNAFVSSIGSLKNPGSNVTFEARIKYLKESVGNTPLNYIERVNGSKICAKIEYYNPFSHSVKDRTAAYMITKPFERGEINPLDSKVWIEASSGNLGIAYGKIGAYLGIKTFIVVPNIVGKATFERVERNASYCEITPGGYCPRGERDGAIKRVADIWMSAPDNYVFKDQYSSKDNVKAHEETTGPEFWKQTDEKLTTLVLAPGTGGTIVGSARYLKSQNPEIDIIAVQPQKEHHIQGVRNFEESMKPIIFKDNENLISDYIEISDKEALEGTVYLWRRGYYVGTSSGLNYAAARKIAKKEKDSLITTLFPDSYFNSYKLIENFITSEEILKT